jgi:alpha-D-ribose 1-methylphosphonate 5-triphosphate diphosphatase PhnM
MKKVVKKNAKDKSSGKIKSVQKVKKMTIEDLAKHTDKKIEDLAKHTDKKIEDLAKHTDQKIDELAVRTDKKIEDLAISTAQGFTNTVTKEYLDATLKSAISEAIDGLLVVMEHNTDNILGAFRDDAKFKNEKYHTLDLRVTKLELQRA